MWITLPFFLFVMVTLVMPSDLEDVPDDLENEDGFEAAGE